MAILVPRWLDFSWQVRLQMCLKVCMVKIANRTRAQTRSTITPVPHLEVLPSAQKGPHLIAEPDGFLNQIKSLIKRRSHSINFNIDTRQLLHMITFRPVHAQPRSRYLRLPNYSILVLICQQGLGRRWAVLWPLHPPKTADGPQDRFFRRPRVQRRHL